MTPSHLEKKSKRKNYNKVVKDRRKTDGQNMKLRIFAPG